MRMVKLMSLNPARLLKLEGGRLYARGPADLTVIDPDSNGRSIREDFVAQP